MRTALLPLSMSRYQRSRREQCSAGEAVHVVQGHPLSLLLLHLPRGQVSRTEGFPHASRLFFFLTGWVSNEDHVVLVLFPPASMVNFTLVFVWQGQMLTYFVHITVSPMYA